MLAGGDEPSLQAVVVRFRRAVPVAGGIDAVTKYMATGPDATLLGLEDLPPQSCRRHRLNGPVRRPDDLQR
jgi:hypothetical protein